MRRFFSIITMTLLMLQPSLAFSKDCVILLHGLAKSSESMNTLEKALTKAGFHTVNHSYPSTEATIQTLAQTEIPKALEACPENNNIHFVSHSMGGLLIRYYLDNYVLTPLGRVVMLAPPNQGSELVDTFQYIPGFDSLGGPAATQLGTRERINRLRIGNPHYEVGIIAGTRSVNPILSILLPDQDDGKVSLERTKLVGSRAHLSVPATHPFIMKNTWVIEETINFLQSGGFVNAPTERALGNDAPTITEQIVASVKNKLWYSSTSCWGACYNAGRYLGP